MERWARGNKPYTGAPDGSVPHNICSACKFLLARTFGKNDTSLEGKCCWERDSAGCWREFVVWSIGRGVDKDTGMLEVVIITDISQKLNKCQGINFLA